MPDAIPPAARPGGEGTPTDEVAAAHSRLLDLVLSRKYSGASLQKAIRELIAAAEQRGRSPAPASGAPGEDEIAELERAADDLQGEVDELADWQRQVCEALAGAVWEGESRGPLFPDVVIPAINDLAARLAAAERAGEALREKLPPEGTRYVVVSDPLLETLSDWSEPVQVRVVASNGGRYDLQFRRAALTPTAPSPEERANG